jgi:hypothetical protein
MPLVQVADERFAALLEIEAVVVRYGKAANFLEKYLTGDALLRELKDAGRELLDKAKRIASERSGE